MSSHCFMCGDRVGEDAETMNGAHLCADCAPSTETDGTDDTTDRDETPARWNAFAEAAFNAPENGVYPPERLEREQWMGHADKKPFAPWTDPDDPAPCSKDHCSDHEEFVEDCPDCQWHKETNPTCAECGHSARYKWSYTENYRDGETIQAHEELLATDHYRASYADQIDGRAFIQLETDPYAYVDGDDVRCPETGEIHPVFLAFLEHIGLTYTDISTSGAGVHALYRGEIPVDGENNGSWYIDTEPWGKNDDLPAIEIYTGKRVCVDTGKHVPGTPTDIREWNADAVVAILKANDEITDDGGERPDPDRFDFDLDDYEPEATGSDETTDEIRDILTAVDRLDAQRVADRTIVHRWNDSASTSGGERAFYPTWGANSNGTANIVNDDRWLDTGVKGGYGGPVTMAAIDAGEIPPENAEPVSGGTWWRGIEHLRDLGFSIPEFEPTEDDGVEHTAILPDDPTHTAITSGWDWRSADSGDGGLTVGDARDRTCEAIKDAFERANDELIEALPSMGKSYGSTKAAAETGRPITIATGRGRKEQYDQYKKWCDEFGLTYLQLPAVSDCPTFNGDHGEDWERTFKGWYNAGARPKEMHMFAEDVTGNKPPCECGEGSCLYKAKWDFDPDDYDVLIGHYNHLHNDNIVKGRSVVVDEFPGGTYETILSGERLSRAVSTFLGGVGDIPFHNWTDLIENRDDKDKCAETLLWFDDFGAEREGLEAFADGGHALAPLAVFALVGGEDLGNGLERCRIGGGREKQIATYNRETGVLSILQPPALDYARNVVALDGTPTEDMWRKTLGKRLTHRTVLDEHEREEYITDALNLQLIRTTDAAKSYAAGTGEIANRVTLAEDRAMLEAIGDVHDEKPALITTKRAWDHVYEPEGVDELVTGHKHYGNVLGSNEYGDVQLGAVVGSRNFGPEYVKRWGAYLNETIEPRFPGEDFELEPGAQTDYGDGVGAAIQQHMTGHETLQAAMRFGRSDTVDGAVVYVHTDTLPDWVPIAGEGRVVRTRSAGERQVVEAGKDLGEWTTAEMAEHPEVEVGVRQVRKHLQRLADRGLITRRVEGRGYVWEDDGLHRCNEHGEVDLEPVEIDDLPDESIAELDRLLSNRWEFRKTTGDSPPSEAAADDSVVVVGNSTVTVDGPPGPST